LALGIVAGGLVLLLVFGRDLRQWWAGHFQPRITFADRPASPKRQASQRATGTPAAVFEGEVARTEVRLREASAVAIAAALAGLAAYAEGRPAREVSGLLGGMQERGLLPPGVTRAGDDTALETAYGTLHLRFRPQPFAVEVLALGRERRDGPALLLRVPEAAAAQAGPQGASRYFSSLTLSEVKIPPPFATPTAILACGWRAETFRPTPPAGVTAAELEKWAAAQSQQSQVAGQTSELPR
jgi:hypothetical protein